MRRNRKLALTATAVLATGGALIAGGAPAWATTASRVVPHMCAPDYCATMLASATLWSPNDTAITTLRPGQDDIIACWFFGNPKDGYPADNYWDHVIWTEPTGDVQGHVDDDAVNLGGSTPPLVGLLQC